MDSYSNFRGRTIVMGGMLLLALLLFTMLYAMRTLLGMRHRRWYPLIRYRKSNGTGTTTSIKPEH